MKKSILVFLVLSFCFVRAVSAQQGAVAAAPVNLAPTSGYLLGPGDVVGGKVMGESQFDFTAVVDENGNIEVPFFEEPISAMCKNGNQLKSDLTKAVGKYLRNPQVGLTIERKSRPPVTVTGEVRTPGQVTIVRETRLLELISFSGGETENAGGNVEVFRQRPPMCGDSEEIAAWNAEAANSTGVPSRVYSLSLVKSGSTESNPVVNPGDIVVVQKAAPVYIVGEVRNPTGLYIKDGGLRLTQAVAMVGGVTREAKTKDVKIYRRKPNSIDQEILSVNLDAIKKGEQKDIMLEPNDQIEVDKTKKSVAQTILELATGTARTAVGGLGGAIPQRILY
jgi:polysaccharide export outer membrane protein